jgi:hypothetical protein
VAKTFLFFGCEVADWIVIRNYDPWTHGRASILSSLCVAITSRATEAAFSATALVSGVAKTATYTRAYAESNGYLTLLSDGERLTGAYALGPEAGEWLQQATLAIRARVPLDVLRDTIQPFPTFSEIYIAALKALRAEIAAAREQVGARSP